MPVMVVAFYYFPLPFDPEGPTLTKGSHQIVRKD